MALRNFEFRNRMIALSLAASLVVVGPIYSHLLAIKSALIVGRTYELLKEISDLNAVLYEFAYNIRLFAAGTAAPSLPSSLIDREGMLDELREASLIVSHDPYLREVTTLNDIDGGSRELVDLAQTFSSPIKPNDAKLLKHRIRIFIDDSSEKIAMVQTLAHEALIEREAAQRRSAQDAVVASAIIALIVATMTAYTILRLRRDIRRRIELESALSEAKGKAEAANLAKTSFLAHMSHEIRTPITAVLGFAEVLQHGQISEETRQSYASTIVRNGKSLLHLINDILDLAKVESGQIELTLRPVAFVDLLSEVSELFARSALAKGLEFRVQVADNMPKYLLVDEVRIRQILINLVGNALKFTTIGSILVEVIWCQGDPAGQGEVRMTVTDTGPGIKTEYRERLFQTFSQPDSALALQCGGSGLGLALSRLIARKHGGDVVLAQTALRGGSTFVATIRAEVSGDKQIVAPNPEPRVIVPSGKPLLGRTLLVADDSPDNRLLVSILLRDAGAKVETVNDGQDAVEKCAQYSYDVVLMDVQMPRLGGHEATATLRRIGYRKPIIALSAHAMLDERLKSLQAGCNEHLTKPIDRNQLIAMVSRIADSDHPN